MIELSVCLPLFRAKYCGWIGLESLARQKNINFEWELIICEETFQEAMGIQNIMAFVPKLRKAGCARMKYIPLGIWIPLSTKIILMLKNRSKGSKIYCGAAADVYSPPGRLRYQYDLFKRKPEVDWCANGKTIVYDIKSERVYLNDSSLGERIRGDATGRSVRMSIMRHFNKTNVRKGVDGTIFRFCREFVESKGKEFIPYVDHETDNWKYGFNTHGFNNLTLGGAREMYFSGINRPSHIVDCPIAMKDTIPSDILKKLKRSKRYLNGHNKTGVMGFS
jgi:hypothetical protein